ncbi:hypothetical protein KCP71_19920 [Salmonella enterica subsp. enterica]|nr:hypothetical protein KCP71_19920 [Salmonella enterica subsp. enterica]
MKRGTEVARETDRTECLFEAVSPGAGESDFEQLAQGRRTDGLKWKRRRPDAGAEGRHRLSGVAWSGA